jgi:hypothetical protein
MIAVIHFNWIQPAPVQIGKNRIDPAFDPHRMRKGGEAPSLANASDGIGALRLVAVHVPSDQTGSGVILRGD